MKKRLPLALLCLVLMSAVLVVAVSAIQNSDKDVIDILDSKTVAGVPLDTDLQTNSVIIPDGTQIEASGCYPKNENGESYGPEIYSNTRPEFVPDLILAQNEDGIVGYIKRSDIDGGAATLEEALNWVPKEYTVPMYTEDGVTVIGEFHIG